MGGANTTEFSDIEAKMMRLHILHGHVRKERPGIIGSSWYDEPIPDHPWGHLKTWEHVRQR